VRPMPVDSRPCIGFSGRPLRGEDVDTWGLIAILKAICQPDTRKRVTVMKTHGNDDDVRTATTTGAGAARGPK
jgi:hypothetical protein